MSGMELAPCVYFRNAKHKQVVKASLGHFPQPFLIRDVKRTGTKVKEVFLIIQILVLKF
jgi:hypothetical protein